MELILILSFLVFSFILCLILWASFAITVSNIRKENLIIVKNVKTKYPYIVINNKYYIINKPLKLNERVINIKNVKNRKIYITKNKNINSNSKKDLFIYDHNVHFVKPFYWKSYYVQFKN